MVGKWHLCPTDEMNLASTRRNWPTGRGFERWYGFLGAETNQWYPDLVYDNHMVDQPATPEEGYHLTDDLTDKALEFINDAKAIAPEKPFFLYYAPGACHAPHHAPKEWIDRFKGRFDMGYEAMREQTLARQKELGIVPADTELPPLNPIGTPETRTGPDGQPFPALDYTRPWDSLTDDEKRLFCAHGRGLRRLPRPRRPPHRPPARLPRGDRAAREHAHHRRVRQRRERRGRPERLGQRDEVRQRHPRRPRGNLAMIDELGGPKTYNHYPNGWAMAFNTPFKMWKRYEFNGGTSDPCIISWPAGIEGAAARSATSTTTRSTSCRRFSTCSASSRPRRIEGHTQSPFDGVSMRSSFDDAARRIDAGRRSSTRCSAPAGSGTRDGRRSRRTRRIAGWGDFNDDEWELYHTDVDRSELHDLAAEHPTSSASWSNIWFSEAGANVAFPLDDRSPLEIFITPRPQLRRPRDRYVYFPGAAPTFPSGRRSTSGTGPS